MTTMAREKGDTEERYGVLLYYKYATIPDLNELRTFYESNCSSLGLLGRIRLAHNGVNVTVGGKLSSLEKHIALLKLNSVFEGTDFKLASCDQPLDDKVARECGFTSLSVRVVEELVTFASHPLLRSPEISKAGRHLTALEFHSFLQKADKEGPVDSKDIVLLDARNLYETRIGKFQTSGVETLDPRIRQYSDLPSWIDNNSEKLRGKNVLMYCTGGIRCEMASAYIRSKGTGFENVFQLFGGIQRYLEQFPGGGFFNGKNFVFDHRISIGSSDANIMGTCLVCSISFDDYSSRCRCSYCRMLVLVCNSCQLRDSTYVCELCKRHAKVIGSSTSTKASRSHLTSPQLELNAFNAILPPPCKPQGNMDYNNYGADTGAPRRLRILCLHGFRQNAASFKGRTASLAKKLKNIAELVFIDAPHELPFIYQPNGVDPRQINESSLKESPPPVENCKKRFAWLVAPDMSASNGTSWKMAESPFDPLQYQHQTGGFEESLAYLKNVCSQKGPFDGLLGFSQGAAMVASICAQQVLNREMCFRFVIVCSGFALKLQELDCGLINWPSLHIFGGDQLKDRQITNQVSRDLASLFEEGSRVVVEHDSGHIIPTRSPYINEIKDFLLRFL